MSDWTDDENARLRKLWNEVPQISTAEIGRRMGCSKNAVIGKAQRLFLTPRGVAPPVPTVRVLLSDSDVLGCRYIKGSPLPLRPGMYCGEKVAAPELPYCPTHYALCHVYTPPPKD